MIVVFLFSLMLITSGFAQSFYPDHLIAEVKTLQDVMVVQTSFVLEDNQLSTPCVISNLHNTVISQPLLRKHAEGMIAIVWQSITPDESLQIEAAIYSPLTGWEPSQVVSNASPNPGEYSIDFNEEGLPIVFWEAQYIKGPKTTLIPKSSSFNQYTWIITER